MRKHPGAACTFGALLAACLTLSAPARAGKFDVATGTVSTDGAAIAYSFDSLAALPDTLQMAAYDASESPVDVSTLEFPDARRAIEGQGEMLMGGTTMMLAFRFTHPEVLLGHRAQVLVWTRAHGTALAGAVHWDVPGSGGQGNLLVGQITMLPTGRATDDGWVEYSSGSFDFYLGGRIAPVMEFLDTQYMQYDMESGQPTATFDPSARGELDALEVDDLGPSVVPDALCTVSTEDADCGSHGLCYYGRCVDGVAVKGGAPQGALRDEYLSRRAFEFEHFTGIRAMDAIMSAFETAIAALRTAPDKAFWYGLTEAWSLGRDPHGNPPMMNYLNGPDAIGMCTHLGTADMLPSDASGKPAQVPLIFWVDHTFGPYAALQPGDALTAIDGMAVDQWKQKNKRLFYTLGDPLADAVVSSPDIPLAAARVGSVLTFSRCPPPPSGLACKANEVVTFDLDMRSAYAADLWAGFDVTWSENGQGCDWRFLRVPSTDYISDYMHAVSADDGDVRTLEFNGVPDENDPSSADWVKVVDTALQPPMSRFILDERQGDGGTFNSVIDISSRLLPATLAVTSGAYPRLERPLDVATADRFITCAVSGGGYDMCGMFIDTGLGGTAAGSLQDARLAVLISMDVSGNDFLTRFLTYRTGPTRIFGPGPTEGGFGNIIMVGTHMNEMFGGSFQMTDSDFHLDDLTAPPVLQSLTGVKPDQYVFQTQSDIVAGKDTLIETAKAWLRQP